MNQSPNSLRDNLRIKNADLSSLDVIIYNDTPYVTESSLNDFMKSNGIDSAKVVISSICEEYSLDNVEILKPVNEDTELNDLYEIINICESLDPKEVRKVSEGPNQIKMFLDKSIAFVLKKEYNDVEALEKEIKKCDRVLDDIKDERKIANDNKQNSAYKFKLTYLFNIAKSIFDIFVAPALVSKTLKVPKIAAKFMENKKIQKLVKAVDKVTTFTSNHKAIDTGLKVSELLDAGVPEDIKGIYLSFADYNSLLDYYEKKIESVKRDLEFKLEDAKHKVKKENKSMFELQEDFVDGSAESVKYVSPEELKMKSKNIEPDVLHSDGAPGVNDHIQPEIPTPNEKPIIGQNAPTEFNPSEVFKKAYAEPANVLLTKYNDKYYINHDDIDRYMQNSNTTSYDTAVDHIVKANNDPALTPDSVKIVMRQSELENCDRAKHAELEAASVEFEVYPD